LSRHGLKAAAVLFSLASAGCLQATEPTYVPSAASRGQSTRSANRVGSATVDQTDPDAPRGLFPLDVGNRWRYSFTSTISGPDVPGGRVVWLTATTTTELVGRVRIGPLEYVDARVTTVRTLPAIGVTDTLVGSVGYREDSGGLYELPIQSDASATGFGDAVALLASKRASGVSATSQIPLLGFPPVLPRDLNVVASSSNRTEIKVLAYPLHHGATWTVADPILGAVDGVDVLDLPIGRLPAFRIRNFAPGVQDYEVQSWWSRRGLLKDRSYYRLTCLDPICPPRDTFGEDLLTVEEIHLSKDPAGR
jgi:hypothetical protein